MVGCLICRVAVVLVALACRAGGESATGTHALSEAGLSPPPVNVGHVAVLIVGGFGGQPYNASNDLKHRGPFVNQV